MDNPMIPIELKRKKCGDPECPCSEAEVSPDLHELAAACEVLAKAKGWDPCTIDNFVGKIGVAFTEIAEADDEAGSGTVAAVHEEVADITVRVLSVLHGCWGQRWSDRTTFRHKHARTAYEPVLMILRPTFKSLAKAIQFWRKGNDDDARVSLEIAVLELYRVSDRMGFDLTVEILRKLEVNKGRPPLHGNRRSLG